MQLLQAGLLLSCAVLTVHAADVVCGAGRTKKTVTLKAGESANFYTSAPGTEYKKNVKCQAVFKRARRNKCELNFSCEAFALTAANAKCKGRSDFFMVSTVKKTRFCQATPDTSTKKGKLTVKFISNKRSQGGPGAVCTATCLAPGATTQAPPATTPAPPATTPAPPATTVAPTPVTGATTPTTTAGSGNGAAGYTQAWLRGPGMEEAHAHEGVELAGDKGFVAAGSKGDSKLVVMRVNTAGATVWTKSIGTSGKNVGYTVVEAGDKVIVGGGLNQAGKQKATLLAMDTETGATVWTTTLDHSGHGGIRSVILDGETLVATGYVGNAMGGFVFIAEDGSEAVAWRFDMAGNLLASETLRATDDHEITQGAKIKADPIQGGFVVATTVWSTGDQQQTMVVKLDSNLKVEWTKDYGLASGQDQCFDILVDSDGNYLLGGHTTAGTGVVNWDYLAIKVEGSSRSELWRRTYGQPRGFDPRYIHDEMYGVALDQDGNYLLLGGSGDEYSYSESNNGWSSDVWVSYLVGVSKEGETLFQDVFGTKAANNAGEWITAMRNGDVMIYTDSDTVPGFGFLKLTKN